MKVNKVIEILDGQSKWYLRSWSGQCCFIREKAYVLPLLKLITLHFFRQKSL